MLYESRIVDSLRYTIARSHPCSLNIHPRLWGRKTIVREAQDPRSLLQIYGKRIRLDDSALPLRRCPARSPRPPPFVKLARPIPTCIHACTHTATVATAHDGCPRPDATTSYRHASIAPSIRLIPTRTNHFLARKPHASVGFTCGILAALRQATTRPSPQPRSYTTCVCASSSPSTFLVTSSASSGKYGDRLPGKRSPKYPLRYSSAL